MKSLRLFDIGYKRLRPNHCATFNSKVYSDVQARKHVARRTLTSFLVSIPAVLGWCYLLWLVPTLGYSSPGTDAALNEINKSILHAFVVAVIATILTVAMRQYVHSVLFRDSYGLSLMNAGDYEVIATAADLCPPVQAWVVATKDRAADYRKANLRDVHDFYRSWSGANDLTPEERQKLIQSASPEYAARKRAIQRLKSRH